MGKIVSQYDGSQVLSPAPCFFQVFTPNLALYPPVAGVFTPYPGGWIDECIVTYGAGAPAGPVWIYLIGNTQGIVPADGWTPGSTPPAWAPDTVYHAVDQFISNPMDGYRGKGPLIYWYVASGGTSGAGPGPMPQMTIESRNNPQVYPTTYQSMFTGDGTMVWGLGSDPNIAAQLGGGIGTSGPCLLESPMPINHTTGFEDGASILEHTSVKYFGGALGVVSRTRDSLTIANTSGPWARFSFKGK